VFENTSGRDRLQDFKDGIDKFALEGLTFGDLTFSVSGRNNTLIESGGQIATVMGVKPELITVADFV
jgi:hypothetical protein